MSVTASHLQSLFEAKARELAGLHSALSVREDKQYSLCRAIRGLLTNDLDGFERELSDHYARKTGRKPSTANSVLIPLGLIAQRDLTAASASGGGHLVGADNGPVIDMLRARSVTARLGATILSGLVGNVALPKVSAGSTHTWLANEGSQAAESTPTTGQVLLTPRTVSAFVEVSRTLLLQSDAEAIIARDLASAVAAAIDAAALNGSGAGGQPLGLLGVVGVNSVAGTSLSWPDVLGFLVNAGGANGDVSGFATTPAIYKLLASRARLTGGSIPIVHDGAIDGRPAIHSMGVPTATLIGGPWEHLVIGEWGAVEISTDAFTKFQTAIVGLRCMFSVDVAVRHPAAFSFASSIT